MLQKKCGNGKQVYPKRGIFAGRRLNTDYKGDPQSSVEQAEDSGQSIRKNPRLNTFFMVMQSFLQQQNFECGKDHIFHRKGNHSREVKGFLPRGWLFAFLAQDPEPKGKEKMGGAREGPGEGLGLRSWAQNVLAPLSKPSPLQSLGWVVNTGLDLLRPSCRPASPMKRTRRENMAPFSRSPAGRITAVEALSPVKVQLAQKQEMHETGGGGQEWLHGRRKKRAGCGGGAEGRLVRGRWDRGREGIGNGRYL